MELNHRRVIYAQDIMNFTGRSKSCAYNMLNQAKASLGKSKIQILTVKEFADFHGIPVSELENSLFGKPDQK
ncbi:hypothetical protein [Algoriphagus pacificus]|uniref:Uncharacterized protein n=1 Tax=Algoriphagus pacificus TaxID=2811234 RepID=A0ABS3CAS3_9BACT|nr:hypothetical protein [Algoriphagus pacificus]MBN7814198.1 hypothetical protein [Algoriphagus pacificus]